MSCFQKRADFADVRAQPQNRVVCGHVDGGLMDFDRFFKRTAFELAVRREGEHLALDFLSEGFVEQHVFDGLQGLFGFGALDGVPDFAHFPAETVAIPLRARGGSLFEAGVRGGGRVHANGG